MSIVPFVNGFYATTHGLHSNHLFLLGLGELAAMGYNRFNFIFQIANVYYLSIILCPRYENADILSAFFARDRRLLLSERVKQTFRPLNPL
jgi:hypothetical protein